jgi:PIN domain nuclease of toxin-antitoxin system
VNPLLLDTCTILWLAGQPELLSPRAQDLLIQPDVSVFVSSISAWEIAVKVRKGKLLLPAEPRVWWRRMLERYRPQEVAVTAEIAFGAVEEILPHGDPADRIVVATARVLSARLLTADKILLAAVPFAVW